MEGMSLMLVVVNTSENVLLSFCIVCYPFKKKCLIDMLTGNERENSCLFFLFGMVCLFLLVMKQIGRAHV